MSVTVTLTSRNLSAPARTIPTDEELEVELSRLYHWVPLAADSERARERIEWLDGVIQGMKPTDRLYTPCLHRLQTLCRCVGYLPKSCRLVNDIELENPHPVSSTATSDVYIGRRGNRRVALKVLRVARQEDRLKVQKAYHDEVIMWKWLCHPNIVPFHGVSNMFPICIVSEWMFHGNISDFLQLYPGEHRVRFIRDIVRGLRHMHSLRIIHGDLKPTNILVNENFTCCLTDFGITSVLCNTHSNVFSGNGTVRYMAPELLMGGVGDNVDAWPTVYSDYYALAMVMWELFTSRLPFDAIRHDPGVLLTVLSGARPPRPEGAENVGFDEHIWDVIQRCWDSSPAHRSLEGLLMESEQSATSETEAPQGSPPPLYAERPASLTVPSQLDYLSIPSYITSASEKRASALTGEGRSTAPPPAYTRHGLAAQEYAVHRALEDWTLPPGGSSSDSGDVNGLRRPPTVHTVLSLKQMLELEDDADPDAQTFWQAADPISDNKVANTCQAPAVLTVWAMLKSKKTSALLAAVPALVTLRFTRPENAIGVFACSLLSLIPLSSILSSVADSLAARGSGTICGNAIRHMDIILLSTVALVHGNAELSKSLLIGSVLSNMLAVMGVEILRMRANFGVKGSLKVDIRSELSLLFVGSVLLVLQTLCHHGVLGPFSAGLAQDKDQAPLIGSDVMRWVVAASLTLAYIGYLISTYFGSNTDEDAEEDGLPAYWNRRSSETVRTCDDSCIFDPPICIDMGNHLPNSKGEGIPSMNFYTSFSIVTVLVACTIFSSMCLIDTIGGVSESINIQDSFIGLIPIPLILNLTRIFAGDRESSHSYRNSMKTISTGAVQALLLGLSVIAGLGGTIQSSYEPVLEPFQIAILGLAILSAGFLIPGHKPPSLLQGILLILLFVVLTISVVVHPGSVLPSSFDVIVGSDVTVTSTLQSTFHI